MLSMCSLPCLSVSTWTLLAAVSSALAGAGPPGMTIAFELSPEGLPLLTARSGSLALRMALDTGTSRTLVGGRVAQRLGLRPSRRLAVASAGAAASAGLCGPADLRLAGLEMVLDCLGWIPEESEIAGVEAVDGLLGADVLARVDLWMDLRRRKLRVAAAGSLLPWVEGEAVPLEMVHRRAAIRVDLARTAGGGARPLLVVDSGASAPALFGGLARRLLTGSSPVHAGRIETPTSSLEVPIAALGGMRVGGRELGAGWTALLPDLTDRREDGVIPLAALGTQGPVLLAVADGVLVTGARLRKHPRPRETMRLAEKSLPAGSRERR